MATFVQWVDAHVREETELATFYLQRFREEFLPAFDAWLALDPLTDASAPLTPFAMREYRLAATEKAERLDREAELLAAEVRRDIQRASNYVFGVVLFAVALFFAGISGRLSTPRLRQVTLALGCLVFLGTVAWVATSPVSLSI